MRDVNPAPSPSAYGLTPRPAIDPNVLAVLAASAELAWPRRAPAPEPEPKGGPAWRFSGRWWARPVASRRERPWARR